MKNHPNSRKIKFKFLGSLIENANDDIALKEYYDLSSRSFGSYFQSLNSTKVATGLSYTEEAILMPELIRVESNDKDFKQKVQDFFTDLEIKTPFSGVELETGLELDNTKPITYSTEVAGKTVFNLPINVLDFIKWRLVTNCPTVAPNFEMARAQRSTTKWFIEDPQENLSKEIEKSDLSDRALSEYLTVKDVSQKVTYLLTALDVDVTTIAKEKRPFVLKEIVEKKPQVFLDLVDNEDLEDIFLIKQFTKYGIISTTGIQPTYVFPETNKILANGIKEMVIWMKNDINSDLKNKMLTEYQVKIQNLK